MAMVGVDSGSLYRRTHSLSLVLGRRPLGAVLHSSNELVELSQWLCHDDSTINIVLELLLLLLLLLRNHHHHHDLIHHHPYQKQTDTLMYY